MDSRKKLKIFTVIIIILTIIIAAGNILLMFIIPDQLFSKFYHYTFNNPERFNSQVYRSLKMLLLLCVISLFIIVIYRTGYILKLKKYFEPVISLLYRVLNLKFLALLIIPYLLVLYILGISRYDLGTDEVGSILYAKHFWDSGFAFCLNNGKLFIIDNYAMLPVYFFTGINFFSGLTEVWHFKLLASLLSLCSIFIVTRIAQKLYNQKIAVLFLFLLVIQPGFGFVASSYFGEIVQAAFFFAAVYLWLKDNSPLNGKKIFIISLLFALTMQTKFQVGQSIFLSLIIFHFIDKKRKALPILFITIAIVITMAAIRLVPAFIYNKGYILPYFKFWFAEFFESTNRTFLITIDRAHFFSKFLTFILTFLLLGGIFIWAKKPFEKFLAVFTLLYLIWWIVYFWLSNYRVLFIGIIPLCFLLAAFAFDFYERYRLSGDKSQNTLTLISSIFFVLLMVYGFSINIIYALNGNNDAVQFDLDGAKSRIYLPVIYDNSQKEFYREAKTILQGADSIYTVSGGQASLLLQFYLGENRIFDKDYLKKSVENSPGAKYVIVDRTAFPLGLEGGYKVLDSMFVQKNLLLKKGEYELYSVSK